VSRIAFLLYDETTALDAVGPYEALALARALPATIASERIAAVLGG
jgi:putative intracellular protease/amidase